MTAVEVRAEVIAGRVANPEAICSRCMGRPTQRRNGSTLCARGAQFLAGVRV